MSLLKLQYLLVMSLTVTACGKKEKEGESGKANVALANAKTNFHAEHLNLEPTGLNPDLYAPTYYGIKMISIGIIQGDGEPGNGNVGSQIWVNPDCAFAMSELESEVDNAQSGEKKMFKYIGINECQDDKITNYFDLARTSEEVNKDLNSQKLPVLPGVYAKASVSFCIGGAKSENIKFQTAGMAEAKGVTLNNCGVTSKAFDPPLEIKEGESVTVALTYDLSEVIVDYGPESGAYSSKDCYVDATKTVRRCAGFPTLTPTVKKE